MTRYVVADHDELGVFDDELAAAAAAWSVTPPGERRPEVIPEKKKHPLHTNSEWAPVPTELPVVHLDNFRTPSELPNGVFIVISREERRLFKCHKEVRNHGVVDIIVDQSSSTRIDLDSALLYKDRKIVYDTDLVLSIELTGLVDRVTKKISEDGRVRGEVKYKTVTWATSTSRGKLLAVDIQATAYARGNPPFDLPPFIPLRPVSPR